MIDRLTLTCSKPELAERYALTMEEDYDPKYNAGPAQLYPVLINTGPLGFSYFYWGVHPDWSKRKAVSQKLVNAEHEQLLEKASYKRAVTNRRCIVPADGFMVWKQISKSGKVPYRITLPDEKIFSVAGIWEEFEDQDGSMIHTFIIITTPAHLDLSEITDRMPAILSESQEENWLQNTKSEAELLEILELETRDDLLSYTVSPRIKSLRFNSPELIKPTQAADQFGNYSLFD